MNSEVKDEKNSALWTKREIEIPRPDNHHSYCGPRIECPECKCDLDNFKTSFFNYKNNELTLIFCFIAFVFIILYFFTTKYKIIKVPFALSETEISSN
jgi:hypothetical protein